MSLQTSLPIGIGTHVELELLDAQGQTEPLAFDLVHEAAADLDQGRMGANTPLAKAIRGKRAGAVIAYTQGDVRSVRIVRVTPAQTPAPPDAAARREAVLEEARRKAARTNADMFAASFSGKWGDYNTDDVIEDLTDLDTPAADDVAH
jgi:hypothetical protein